MISVRLKCNFKQVFSNCVFSVITHINVQLNRNRNRNRNKKFAIARITYKNIRALQEFAIEFKTSKTTN